MTDYSVHSVARFMHSYIGAGLPVSPTKALTKLSEVLALYRSLSLLHHAPLVHSRLSMAFKSRSDAVHSSLSDAVLLDLADPLPDARIILIGPGTLELLCALIRRGCSHAAMMQLTDRSQTGEADLALMPHASSPECIDAAVVLAKRALAPLGTMIIRLEDSSPDALALFTRRTLRLHGFSAVQMPALSDHCLVTAELPLHGRLVCA